MATIALPSVQSLLIEMRAKGNTLSVGTAFVTTSKKDQATVEALHQLKFGYSG